MILSLLVCAGCTPAFNWREIVPEGARIGALFPCRPDHHARDVMLGGSMTRLDMLVCVAGDATFALSFTTLADSTLVAPALADLRAAAAANLGANVAQVGTPGGSGLTAMPGATRLVLDGRRPDGSAVRQQAAFFSRGLQVYQASVIGNVLPPEAVDTFFSGLRPRP